MPSRRYQMSSSERADILVRTLDLDDTFRASRPIGYAYVRVVDVEHPCEACPDHLVHAVDPLARIERIYPDIPNPPHNPIAIGVGAASESRELSVSLRSTDPGQDS